MELSISGERAILVRMRRILVVAFVLALIAPAALVAQTGPVSLGVGAGLVVPHTADEPSFAWGFHVNIPILNTLHLTPASEIYRAGDTFATDNTLAFKFMIPLRGLAPYFGIVPGLTAAGTEIAPHVGGLVGANFPLISNLGAFVQYKYKVVLEGESTTSYSHLGVGALFAF